MARVAVLAFNTVFRDARILKEARVLAGAGYSVRIFGLNDKHNPAGLYCDDSGVEIELVAQAARRPSRDGLNWLGRPLGSVRLRVAGRWAVSHLRRYIRICGIGLSQLNRRMLSLLGYAVIGVVLAAIVAPLAMGATRLILWSSIVHSTTAAIYLGHAALFPAGLALFGMSGVQIATILRLRLFFVRALKRVRCFVVRALKRVRCSVVRALKRLQRLMFKSMKKAPRFARRILHKTFPGMSVARRDLRAQDLSAWASAWAPDIVHAHDIGTLPAGARVRDETGAHLVFDAHEIYEEVAQAPRGVRRAYRKRMTRFQDRVDGFVTINDSIGEFYRKNYPKLPPATIVKNATWLEPAFAYDGCLHTAAGVARDQRIALYQGGFSEKRGLRTLVQAAEFLDPRWTLVMMGWGALEDDLRHIAEILPNAPDRAVDRPAVVFLPPVGQAELVKWTAGASVGLIPYERIGLNHLYCTPNKLWEYPNAGVPIVCSDLVELRKAVLRNQIGWLLPPDADAHSVAATLNRLSDADLETARARCAEYIRKDNFEVYARSLLELYETFGIAVHQPNTVNRNPSDPAMAKADARSADKKDPAFPDHGAGDTL
jgi:glycosyltransferase involved in cell wall biosynthesis